MAEEAIAGLEMIRRQVRPIRSGGHCRIRWIGSDQKLHEENPSIDVRFVPPDRLFLRGNILGSETIRLGSNADEFWLTAPPKEISAYWWGKRSDIQKCPGSLWINPDNLLEVLGLYDLSGPWELTKEERWDVLTRMESDGLPAKRIYLDRCSRRVGKIEYYDKGLVLVSIRLEEYPQDDGPLIPNKITLDGIAPETQASVIITLQNVAVFEPTESQLQGKLFARPASQGFEHVYQLKDQCVFVELSP